MDSSAFDEPAAQLILIIDTSETSGGCSRIIKGYDRVGQL